MGKELGGEALDGDSLFPSEHSNVISRHVPRHALTSNLPPPPGHFSLIIINIAVGIIVHRPSMRNSITGTRVGVNWGRR